MNSQTPMPGRSPQQSTARGGWRPTRVQAIVAVVVVVLAVVASAAYGLAGSGPARKSAVAYVSRPHERSVVRPRPTLTTVAPTTVAPTTVAPTTAPPVTAPPVPTTAAVPLAAGSHGPITSPPLATPGPGFNEGQVTAVGDSVMLDYQGDLQQDIPGVNVQAAVSEQWSAGEAELQQLKSAGQLGAVVIVGLSTNGPISSADFDDMMGILSGASRVVFVNIHVDQPWQDPNNAVLAAGVSQSPNTVLADWYDLAQQNPDWLDSDGTHMPIDGPGAQALANLVAGQA